MAGTVSKPQILALYKQLLRESQKFESYNFKNYALRRVRDAFKENKGLSEQNAIQEQINYGKENVDIIKRQVIVGQLYSTDKLVIEAQQNPQKS